VVPSFSKNDRPKIRQEGNAEPKGARSPCPEGMRLEFVNVMCPEGMRMSCEYWSLEVKTSYSCGGNMKKELPSGILFLSTVGSDAGLRRVQLI